VGSDEPAVRYDAFISYRHVEPDRGDRFDHRHHPGLHQHGGDPDGAVPAHRQRSGDLDEQHPVVGVRPGGRLQYGAGHRGVPTRFVHQQGAQLVEVLDEVCAPLGHRRPGQGADPAGDHPGRHALGV
jgi:hypothetical protein